MIGSQAISEDYRLWIVHHSDPESTAEVLPLSPKLWPKALQRAIAHRVLLIIHEKLQKAGVVIPQPSLSIVRDYVLLQTFRTHHHKRFLLYLGAEIRNLPDFVVLKGFALATRLYPDPFLRPAGDVDILIQRKDYPYWRSFLRQIGFLPQSSDREAWFLEKGYNVGFVNKDQGFYEDSITLELHWELFKKSRSHIWPTAQDRLWKNRELLSLHGVRLPVIRLADLLPYLCFHQLLHQHNRLIWVVDILLLARKHMQDVFDSEVLASVLENRAVRACIYYALHYAHTLFQLPEIADVMIELRPPSSSMYHYLPLLRAEEFVDDRRVWPTVKIFIFREIMKRRGRRR